MAQRGDQERPKDMMKKPPTKNRTATYSNLPKPKPTRSPLLDDDDDDDEEEMSGRQTGYGYHNKNLPSFMVGQYPRIRRLGENGKMEDVLSDASDRSAARAAAQGVKKKQMLKAAPEQAPDNPNEKAKKKKKLSKQRLRKKRESALGLDVGEDSGTSGDEETDRRRGRASSRNIQVPPIASRPAVVDTPVQKQKQQKQQQRDQSAQWLKHAVGTRSSGSVLVNHEPSRPQQQEQLQQHEQTAHWMKHAVRPAMQEQQLLQQGLKTSSHNYAQQPGLKTSNHNSQQQQGLKRASDHNQQRVQGDNASNESASDRTARTSNASDRTGRTSNTFSVRPQQPQQTQQQRPKQPPPQATQLVAGRPMTRRLSSDDGSVEKQNKRRSEVIIVNAAGDGKGPIQRTASNLKPAPQQPQNRSTEPPVKAEASKPEPVVVTSQAVFEPIRVAPPRRISGAKTPDSMEQGTVTTPKRAPSASLPRRTNRPLVDDDDDSDDGSMNPDDMVVVAGGPNNEDMTKSDSNLMKSAAVPPDISRQRSRSVSPGPSSGRHRGRSRSTSSTRRRKQRKGGQKAATAAAATAMDSSHRQRSRSSSADNQRRTRRDRSESRNRGDRSESRTRKLKQKQGGRKRSVSASRKARKRRDEAAISNYASQMVAMAQEATEGGEEPPTYISDAEELPRRHSRATERPGRRLPVAREWALHPQEPASGAYSVEPKPPIFAEQRISRRYQKGLALESTYESPHSGIDDPRRPQPDIIAGFDPTKAAEGMELHACTSCQHRMSYLEGTVALRCPICSTVILPD